MSQPLTNDELLRECKIGLNLSEDTTALDGLIKQKIHAVKAFMRNSGVPQEKLDNDDLVIGTIVIGVSDLWELRSGEVKFSPVFYMLVTQLAC